MNKKYAVTIIEFGELMYLAFELNKARAPKPKVLLFISKIGKIKRPLKTSCISLFEFFLKRPALNIKSSL